MKRIRQTKCFIRCTVFLLIFGYLFIHVSYLLRPTDKQEYKISPGFYAEPKNSLDMLYIGGSACFMYWMPLEAYEKYGFTSYNFGSSAIDAKTLQFALKEALKTQSPSLILIDARPFQYGDTAYAEYITEVGLRNFTDRIKYSWDRIWYLNQLVPSKIREGDSTDTLSYIFDIAKYHTRWTELNEVSWHLAGCSYKYENMGHVFFPAVTSTLQEIGCSHITEITEPNEVLNQVLMELLDYCSQLDAQVLFVVHSYVESPWDRMKYNYLKQVVEKYSNIDFINVNDYNQQIGMDFSKDFANEAHVNAFGAEKYTIFLGQYIKEHYTLPDRRQDKQFRYWDEMLPEWKQTLQENKNFLNALINSAAVHPPAQ